MKEAAQYLVGEHDFRNFCKMDAVNVSNFKRKIASFTFHPVEDVKRFITIITIIIMAISKIIHMLSSRHHQQHGHHHHHYGYHHATIIVTSTIISRSSLSSLYHLCYHHHRHCNPPSLSHHRQSRPNSFLTVKTHRTKCGTARSWGQRFCTIK